MGKLIRQVAPHIRSGATVNKMMLHVLIALLPVTAFSIYSFGLDAVRVILLSVITMVGVEFIYTKINKQETTLKNFTALISGLIFALTLPAGASNFSIIICAALAMYLGKCMFGGLGNNIFNVAAIARVMFALSFVTQVDGVAGSTVLADYASGGLTAALANTNITDLFTGMVINGNVAIGEISALCILIGAAYLVITKSADIKIMLSYVGFAALFSVVIGFVTGSDVLNMVLFQILSGGLLFGAVFMATDPVTAPVLNTSKIYYGFGLALITMLIRVFGSLPEGVIFSILLMNMLTPALEYQDYSNTKFTPRSIIIFLVVILVACGIFAVGL